jgi:hypothetical protein
MSVRRDSQKYLKYLVSTACFASLILIFLQEWAPAALIWVVLLSQLPAMLIAFRSKYLSLISFCLTSLITQIISVPVFYLDSDNYAFSAHRPFSFNISDAVPTILHLAVFQFLVASICIFFQRSIVANNGVEMISKRVPPTQYHVKKKHELSGKYIYFILLIIAFSLPAKFWMFDAGIGIVGTPPPRLPFRLTGILTYFFSWVIPLLIAYLYIKTSRNSIKLSLFISFYALMIGLLSSSKAVVLLVTFPIVLFAWVDRRWAIMILSACVAGLGAMIVEASRLIVHISDKSSTIAFTELGGIGTLVATLQYIEWSAALPRVFISVAGRIESFQGLYMASAFNADAVGGAFRIFLKAINGSWIDLGHDAIHIEFLGYTVPHGFYGVPASINAWMMMASNNNLIMIFPFVFYVASVILLLEKINLRLSCARGLTLPIRQAIIFFSILLFYTSPGGLEFLVLLIGLIIFALFPKYRLSLLS